MQVILKFVCQFGIRLYVEQVWFDCIIAKLVPVSLFIFSKIATCWRNMGDHSIQSLNTNTLIIAHVRFLFRFYCRFKVKNVFSSETLTHI